MIDRRLLVRALILGLAESAVEMAAFLATIAAAGWLPGTSFPSGPPLLAASGAADHSWVLVAALAIPAVLLTDAVYKFYNAHAAVA